MEMHRHSLFPYLFTFQGMEGVCLTLRGGSRKVAISWVVPKDRVALALATAS